MKTTAAIMMAAKVALGMNEKYGVKKSREATTNAAVKILPKGVRTPLKR